MAWFKSFRSQVRIRWWGVTVFSICLIVFSYAGMEAAIQPLFGYTFETPYDTEIPIISALWYVRLWFAIAILLDRFIMHLYVQNSDTEVWQMEEIELTKMIAVYEAELKRRSKKPKE